MAEVEIQVNKVSWRDFTGEVACMLVMISAPWGLALELLSPAGIVYRLAVWLPLMFVVFHYAMSGARWMKLQKGLDEGFVAAKAEWEKSRDIQRGVAEIIHEQSRKNI